MKDKYEAFILITIDPASLKKTSQYLLNQDMLENVHELYGQYDIIVKAVSKNRGDLDDFIEDKIRHVKGIRATETLIVSNELKAASNLSTGLNEAEVYMLVNTLHGKAKDVAKRLANFNQVLSVYELYGQYDILVKIKEATQKQLEDFIQKNIRPMKEIESTETLVVSDVP